jgi:arginine-tRNA-protein transferase
MRYKGDYMPQYMLDPDSYNWDPLDDEMKKKLDSRKFVSLSRELAGKFWKMSLLS